MIVRHLPGSPAVQMPSEYAGGYPFDLGDGGLADRAFIIRTGAALARSLAR
jgi:hypothetical protein